MLVLRRSCAQARASLPLQLVAVSIVRPGETISSNGYSKRPGGKGANVATAIAKVCSLPAPSATSLDCLASLANRVQNHWT